jgi:phosphoesterase RecJ-like protein
VGPGAEVRTNPSGETEARLRGPRRAGDVATMSLDVFHAPAPAGVAALGAPSAGGVDLSGLPELPRRRLPSLRRALVDPAIPALGFDAVHVPPSVLEALERGQRILVVGHVPPDGDCVGSAVGLARALQHVGKSAVAVVDDALPWACRAIDAGNDVRRADEVQGSFDLVVVVDVAAKDRIGGAARFLADAREVLVVDHHAVGADPEALGLRADQRFTAWIAPETDAAAVMVGGIAHRLGGGAAEQVAPTLAGAIYTDTLGFRAPGADLRNLQLFKGVVRDAAGVRALEAGLASRLPPAALAIVEALPPRGGRDLVVDAATWAELGRVARAVDPRTTDGDVRGALLDRLDRLRDAAGSSALVVEEPSGVRVSLRSTEDGEARRVAEQLGGGGHGQSSAVFMPSATLEGVEQRLTAARATVERAREARLRLGRG